MAALICHLTRMKTLLALLTSSVFVVLAGCNTVAGAGKDIERGGEKVQDAAQDVQHFDVEWEPASIRICLNARLALTAALVSWGLQVGR